MILHILMEAWQYLSLSQCGQLVSAGQMHVEVFGVTRAKTKNFSLCAVYEFSLTGLSDIFLECKLLAF